MTNEQIKAYVRQATEEAERAPSLDRFRAFARALPTTVLNVLVNSGKRVRPDDPTEPLGENLDLLLDTAYTLGRMYHDPDLGMKYLMVGTALGIEGFRRQFPGVAIHVPLDPFSEDELELGYRSLLDLPLQPEARTRLQQELDRLFPKSARERRQRRRRVRLMLALGLLLLLWILARRWIF